MDSIASSPFWVALDLRTGWISYEVRWSPNVIPKYVRGKENILKLLLWVESQDYPVPYVESGVPALFTSVVDNDNF